MADTSKDEINRLKSKLKKANSNHEEMVAMWAQQGAEVEKELEGTKESLIKTKQELSIMKKQLRKYENKKDSEEPIVDELKKQILKNETNHNIKCDELTIEISELKDELRHTISNRNDTLKQLNDSNEIKLTFKTENNNLKELLKEKENIIIENDEKMKILEINIKNDKKIKQTLEKEKEKMAKEIEKLNEKHLKVLKSNEEFESLLSELNNKVIEFEEEIRFEKNK